MNQTNEQLIHTIDESKATLQELSEALEERGDMQVALKTLMTSDDLLIDFIKMAQRSPDVMRLVLQCGVSATANAQALCAAERELTRRQSG